MGWKENRRRKRTWYRHYKSLADRVAFIVNQRDEFAAEEILQIIFDLYESRKLHGKRFIANSAYESLRLACKDAGLDNMSFTPNLFRESNPRPLLPGMLVESSNEAPGTDATGRRMRTTAPGKPAITIPENEMVRTNTPLNQELIVPARIVDESDQDAAVPMHSPLRRMEGSEPTSAPAPDMPNEPESTPDNDWLE